MDISRDQLHYFTKITTPIGELTAICWEQGLNALLWENASLWKTPLPKNLVLKKSDSLLMKAERQLHEYFAGMRRVFDLPLAPVGTAFQKKVWNQLTRIPYGRTLSYGGLAAKLGDARKARPVGAANGRNPLPIIVPCHRVIGSTGDLTGFGGGLDVKRYLLELEQRFVSERSSTRTVGNLGLGPL